MRKDVKLGFAIGGVLLAVLVVYVLVISGGDKKPGQVSLVTSDSQDSQSENAGAGAADSSHRDADSSQSPAAPGSSGEDPFRSAAPAVAAPQASGSGSQNSVGDPSRGTSSSADPWSAALNTGKLPLMMTQTPQPAPAVALPPVPAEANSPTPGSGSSGEDAMDRSTVPPIAASNSPAAVAGSSEIPDSAPTTRPVGAGAARTHVVQNGETYSSIAASVYGNSAYWPHISRANPNIDARKLKAGMVINLPPASDVRADTRSPEIRSSVATSSKIDDKTEYRVVSGDSLYKISMKLYGKGTMSDKIYELNKGTIGSNPAHLKLGMVLKLPQPPTATASR